jgi:hypothetical protein
MIRNKTWRVQAFLLPSVTGGTEYAYVPIYCRTRRRAERQQRILRASFAPGMIRIEMVKRTNDD